MDHTECITAAVMWPTSTKSLDCAIWHVVLKTLRELAQHIGFDYIEKVL
jgi:hypothetical protein